MKPQPHQEFNSPLKLASWRWPLAILLVLGFGLLGAVPQFESRGKVDGQTNLVAHTDIPLLSQSASSTHWKRPSNNTDYFPKDGTSAKTWIALVPEYIDVAHATALLVYSFALDALPLVKRHTLKQLNVSGAPPHA